MLKSKFLMIATATLLVFGSPPGLAQTQSDPHHPQQGSETTPLPADQQAGGMSMMDMMDMMAGMMKMMHGGQMGMDGMGMGAMRMTERVEGRIAFLRAELQISDAQSKLWDAYASALRDNAKRLKDSSGGMMADGTQRSRLLEQLDSQEKTLTARLEGIKVMKVTLMLLYESLTEEQRRAADELLAPHMGLMGGGMMRGGMMQGGSMPMQDNVQ